MHEYIQEYYDNPAHSDIKVGLSDDTFIYAHKIVLCRLEFFAHMFESGMGENTGGIVSFPQHDDDAVQALIQHLYGVFNPAKLLYDWCKLYPLAHYVDAQELLDSLSLPNIVAAARVSSYMIVSYAKLYSADRLLADNFEIVTPESTWSRELYEYYRAVWLRCARSHAVLFSRDLAYATELDQINTYAADYIIGDAFISEFPGCDNPAVDSPLVRMIVSLASTRDFRWYTIS